ncbi:MAG: hypothetical protein NWE98_02025 [Candidatus Bathyarchaeota archaeon]|nr:hypothetical protein [Candidatus Bathyarchaeota archaeon]
MKNVTKNLQNRMKLIRSQIKTASKTKKAYLALATIFLVIIVSATIVISLVPAVSIPSSGVVATANLGLNVNRIEWGTIYPNSTVTKTVIVTNLGTVPLTLKMNVEDWNPPLASKYIYVTWDRENEVLYRGESVTASISLTVSSQVTNVTDFSNQIKISGVTQ